MKRKQTKPLSATLFTLPIAFILFIQFLAVVFPNISVQAETRYVKPSGEISVRRGQGNEFKIISMVKDGTAVELLEENESFARIHLSNGKEGWVLKRFLKSEAPPDQLVISLRAENEEIQQRELESKEQLETVSAVLARTEQERDSAISQRDQLQTSYKKLQQDTANVVQIKQTMQKTAEENTVLSRKLALIRQENKDLKNDAALKWFLAGGGVLLFGMLMGRMIAGSRRKKPSLL